MRDERPPELSGCLGASVVAKRTKPSPGTGGGTYPGPATVSCAGPTKDTASVEPMRMNHRGHTTGLAAATMSVIRVYVAIDAGWMER